MTITHTISFADASTTIKTEVEVFHPETIKLSRIINAHIKQYVIDGAGTPVSMDYVSRLSKFDDNTFKLLCETQEPQDEDFGPPTS